MKMEQGVLKLRYIKFIRREITKEEEYNRFCCINHTKHINVFCGRNSLFLNAKGNGTYSYHCVNQLAHIFTTVR
jgi:hypothetical protein